MLNYAFMLYLYTLLNKEVSTYTIYTVDDSNVCNQSIYLEHGPNSAAILKLTSQETYPTAALYCTISFKAPIHKWSGLTGILEQVDLRRYEDNSHHLGQSFCVDYITVLTEKPDSGPNERQCGTWSITPGKPLSRLGYNRALIGYCPHSDITGSAEKCHVTELKVIVSIGREKQALWKNVTWDLHRGFTFVVTAYSYPIKHGESECRDGLRSCSQANTPGARLGVYHCVHDSLWCDGHVNCGLLENMDEISCFKNGMWGGVMSIVVGPWMGASTFLLFVLCGVLYWRASRVRMTTGEAQSTNQELNSYAESYELSSNVSSAHHMAIQVRVVCNSNHPHHSSHGTHQPWKDDLPPAYEALYPQGPPQPYSPITSIIATVDQGTSGNTVSTVGVNVSSTMTVPSTVISTSGTNTRPSPLQPSTASTSDLSVSHPDVTSIIDLNVTSNNFQSPFITRAAESRPGSNVDGTGSTASSQTSVTLTLTPNQNLSNSDPSHSSHVEEPPTQIQESGNTQVLERQNLVETANPSDLNAIVEDNFNVRDGETRLPLEESTPHKPVEAVILQTAS